MSEYMREKKKTAAENAEQEKQLMKALYKLIETYPNYEKPYLRKDGDIVIPLDAVMKQNRAAFSGLATVFSEFMKTDIEGQRKRYSTWVKWSIKYREPKQTKFYSSVYFTLFLLNLTKTIKHKYLLSRYIIWNHSLKKGP